VTGQLRYRVLGPLRVRSGSTWVGVSRPKAAAVLGCLLLHANAVVSGEQLTHDVWGDHQPRRAAASLHVYVSRLRALLDAGEAEGSPLLTRPTGYMMRARPGELDSEVFLGLTLRGRAAAQAGDYYQAEALLVEAMGLWAGPVLDAASDGPLASVCVATLEESLLECTELRMEVGLRLGHHRQLISTLRRLTIEHPLHEGLRAYLMRALWASGRRADALEAFRSARDDLRRELALEPGRALQQLHTEILADDRAGALFG